MKTAPILVLILLFMHSACAQQRVYDHAVTVQSDNDNFAGHLKDGYYTNGLLIRYSYLPRHFKTHSPVIKATSWYSIGQQIFTSESIDDEFLFMIDRPFSAYLYLQKGYQLFYKNGRALKLSISAGLTGKGAGGKQVQNTFHDIMKLIHTRGWDYQLRTAAAISAEAEGFSIAGKQKKTGPATHFYYQVRTGSVFDDLTAGVLMRFGKKQPLVSSCFTEANLGADAPSREIFFYLWPRLRYQVYNATVQGGLFMNDKGPFTAPLQHGQWIAESGFCVSGKQQSFTLAITAQAREARTMRHNMVFGSVAYRHLLHIRRKGVTSPLHSAD